MIKEAIGTGNTIDEAKEAALADLLAGENDDIQFEIISFPKKKTLGLFGGSLAQVRAYVELPEPKPAKKPAKSEKKKSKPEKKSENRPEKKVVKKEEPLKEKLEESDATQEPFNGVPIESLKEGSSAAKAAIYLKKVLAGLGCENLEYLVEENEDGAKILISGEDTGVVIGHRGETLDALQYLCSLAATKKGEGYYRVMLNIGNYREKRAKTLEGVARKTAANVLRTGRSRSLEPMNPYERRIIHTTVQTIEGVTSASVGGGNARRVVISPEGGERKDGRRYDRRPHGDRRSSGSNTLVSNKTDKTVDSASTPLYGRIN